MRFKDHQCIICPIKRYPDCHRDYVTLSGLGVARLSRRGISMSASQRRFPPPLVCQKVDIGAQDDGDMLALSDSQLRALWEAAAGLPIEKRGIFLMRLVAQLQLRSHFTTADLDDAVRLALKGLIQKSAA
jgi:hypothetical protein